MSEMRSGAREMARGIREAEPEETLGGVLSFMESIPTSTYYIGMIGSVLASLWLFATGRKWESVFVGLWAPTFLTAGMFYKLLRPSRELTR